jgi:hypothetical protein
LHASKKQYNPKKSNLVEIVKEVAVEGATEETGKEEPKRRRAEHRRWLHPLVVDSEHEVVAAFALIWFFF